MKPKLLLITRNLPPLTGGMERLTQHMIKELAQYYDCHVIGPSQAVRALPANVKLHGVSPRPLACFLALSWCKALALSLRYRLHAIIAGNGLMTTIATAAHLGRRTPIVTLLHGLDIVINNPVYRKAVIPLIRRSTRVVANSNNTAKLALQIGVDPRRIDVVNPAVEMPEGDDSVKAVNLRNLEGKRVLLSVGRIIRRKGLAAFVEHSFPKILNAFPDALLVVAGDTPTGSLKKETPEMDAVLSAATVAGLRDRLVFLGQVNDATLRHLYQIADVHIFPVRDVPGDVEGFGMVTLEAAASGLPTVAFNAGGVADAIIEEENGTLIEPDDYREFADAVERYLAEKDRDEIKARCRAVAAMRSWHSYGERVARIIEQARST